VRREATLILGGGPAGSAAAITLARAGQRPLLLERQRQTGDALCGGFLSWHSLAALDRLGAPKLRGATIDRVRLFARNASAEAALPQPALGVTRHQLDTVLLNHAEALGARVERGVHAREIESRIVHAEESFEVERLLLATGKHDIRGVGRPREDDDPALGLRVRLGPSPGLAKLVEGAIELHLFDRGYAGLALHEDGSANLCLAVRKSRLGEAGGPRGLLEAIGREVPPLGDRLASLTEDTATDAIAAIPYGWRATDTLQGVYRLGDQCGVIPSLAGEGMGIALASGIAAGEAVLRSDDARTYQRVFARRIRRPIAIAGAILSAAERPLTAPMLVGLMRTAPGLATLVARATRVGH
jgi:flavin-dependent dehydrogenase